MDMYISENRPTPPVFPDYRIIPGAKASESVAPGPKPMGEIHILGSASLQNTLLAAHLSKETGIPCYCQENPNALPVHAGVPTLVLWDAGGRRLDEVFISAGSAFERMASGSSSLLLALFNASDKVKKSYKAVLGNGIKALFFEDAPLELLVKGIRNLLSKGECWFPRSLLNQWVRDARYQSADSNNDPRLLSKRQKQILLMVASGASNDDISDKLSISYHTVKTHLSNIYRKIGATNRLQATLWAAKNL